MQDARTESNNKNSMKFVKNNSKKLTVDEDNSQ
jgi:hypothetical protein